MINPIACIFLPLIIISIFGVYNAAKERSTRKGSPLLPVLFTVILEATVFIFVLKQLGTEWILGFEMFDDDGWWLLLLIPYLPY